MTKLLQRLLYVAAKLWLRRNKPKIVAITGNVGKTSAKDALLCVLSRDFLVRGPEKNFNNEIGVPLTILAWPHYGRNLIGWFFRSLSFPFSLLIRDRTEILVLEFGADRPGDIKNLANLAPPDIAVVTAIGEIPVHIEFFGTADALTREKAELVRALRDNGHAVLNADDHRAVQMRSLTDAAVTTFGFSDTPNIKIENEMTHYGPDGKPEGISFKISHDGSVLPVRLMGSLSRPQTYAAAAAYAVGRILGMNPVEIVEALRRYTPPPGRMRIIPGNKYSTILDDTYNASPKSVESALETLRSVEGGRKIAVLGDMLELGEFTEAAHRNIGKMASEFVSLLVTVGTRAEFIREEAIRCGLPEEKTKHFLVSTDVDKVLEPMLAPGDLVLVKGSQGMRMERVVAEIMREPWRRNELLCRQSPDWLVKS